MTNWSHRLRPWRPERLAQDTILGTLLRVARLGLPFSYLVLGSRELGAEGFSMVIIKSSTHGIPPVAFSAGGLPDDVSNKVSGDLICSGDYAEFTQALIAQLRHADDYDRHNRCVAFARTFALPQFGEQVRALVLRFVNVGAT